MGGDVADRKHRCGEAKGEWRQLISGTEERRVHLQRESGKKNLKNRWYEAYLGRVLRE